MEKESATHSRLLASDTAEHTCTKRRPKLSPEGHTGSLGREEGDGISGKENNTSREYFVLVAKSFVISCKGRGRNKAPSW